MFHGGSAFNVIPDEVNLCGTIRTLSEETRHMAFKRIKGIAQGISNSMGASAEFKLTPGYPVTKNSPAQTQFAFRAAEKVVGKENIITDFPVASMGSEDFSFMLQEKPGCYVLIGNADMGDNNPCMLHNPYYDFNDKILPVGASYFVAIAEQRLI